jgi:hypothetical protein
MDYFYVIVLTIAVVILILLLTLFGISMRKQTVSGPGSAWPPVEATCPDYWQLDKSDAKYCLIPKQDPLNPLAIPKNTGSIFSTSGGMDPNFAKVNGYDSNGLKINFADPYYTVCNKQNWSKTWGIYWDGYTNYNGKC